MSYLISIATTLLFLGFLFVPLVLFIGFSIMMLSPLFKENQKQIFKRGSIIFCGASFVLITLMTLEKFIL
jgi:hypothetical protein